MTVRRIGLRSGAAFTSVALGLSCLTGLAVAYFDATDSTVGAQATSDSLPTGATPSASVSGRNVSLSFNQAFTTTGETAITTYQVNRYSVSNNGTATSLGTCTATITGTTTKVATCVETGQPSGTSYYTETPVISNWSGGEAATRVSATVGSPSLTITSSTTLTTLPTTLNGSIANFVDGQALTFHLDSATGTALSGTPSTVPTGGSASITVTIPSGTSNGSHVVYAVTGNGESATANFSVSVNPPNVAITFPVNASTYNAATYRAGCSTSSTDDFCGTSSATATGATIANVKVSVEQNGASPKWWNPTTSAFDSSAEVLFAVTSGTTSWSTTFASSRFADGSYTIRAVATDSVGGTGSASTTFTYDNTGPAIASVAIGPQSVQSVGFVGPSIPAYVYANVSDALSGVNSVTATLPTGGNTKNLSTTSSVTLSAISPVTISGTQYNYRGSFTTGDLTQSAPTTSFSVSATDGVTNSTSQSGTVTTSDQTAPAAALTYPVSGTTYGANWAGAISGTASDAGGSGLYGSQVSIASTFGSTNGQYWNAATSTWQSGQVWNDASGTATWSYTFAQDGKFSVTARSYDNAGNLSTITSARTFTIDSVAPSISALAIGPQNPVTTGYIGNGVAAYVYANASDSTTGVSTVAATLPTALTTTTTVSLTFLTTPVTVGGQTYNYRGTFTAKSSLTNGSAYSFSVAANDAAGNSASTSGSVAADTVAPTNVAITSPTNNQTGVAYNPVTIQGTSGTQTASTGASADLAPTLSITGNGAPSGAQAVTWNADGTWTYTFVLVKSKSYTVTVTQYDAAGNSTTASVSFTTSS